MTVENDADTIMRFADTLLPGDVEFPSASASGMAGLLIERLAGAGLAERLLAAIASAGGPREVARIEADAAELFDEVRKIAYLTYYEQETVVAAIRTVIGPYNWAPLPEGFPNEKFDPAIDVPTHGRGRWTPTDEVVPVP